ncbi:MAG: fibronectin/fibrinogen-binding protein [Clostridiales bacterium]|nr:fibronectin/fibrinogen-binding protein [Clostridiales bacterium]
MSFDGFVTRCVTDELRSKLLNGKIDKVYQPEKDEIILSVRTRSGNYKLLLSASASNPRIHLTEVQRENPMTPPMLCMLMRKHLAGAVIIDIKQNGFDRVVRIDAETRNELGDLCTRSVIIEIMGRHSNIILVDDSGRIMDSAKHIDFTVSAVRQVLPGMTYELPPAQDKTAADSLKATGLMEALAAQPEDTLMDKFLLSEIMGMSPLLAREIVYRFSGNTKMMKCEVDCAAFVVHTVDFLKNICGGIYEPSLVIEPSEKKPVAFSCVRLSQYEGAYKIEEYDSISEVIDSFFEIRSRREHMNRRSAALLKLIHNNIERCQKKIVMHKEHIRSAQDRDKYKMYGDLLTANLYRIKYGDKSVSVQNYYSESGEKIEIPLKADISPSQNAQRFYKRYNKAKTTEKFASEQLEIAENEKYYLESVADALENADTPVELDEIRQELMTEGYIAKQNNAKKKQQKKSEPIKIISVDGYEILIGRNNRQNDELTLKSAYSTDLWFHTKEIPGSHTIIRTRGTGEAPEPTMMQAAKLAAYYSKARNSSKVPVDYTLIKNVKKPNGAKPGMVIYDRYNTVYVTPSEE